MPNSEKNHLSIYKGIKKEIFYNMTNLIIQKMYFISKLPLKNWKLTIFSDPFSAT